ncbi:hypothetical protein Ciccas_013939 [Cichlidogyrus casuarinus]|uniref:Uncharacterized protein n=1 Tax=Cichlidogyrus casuarinus TaxID=1844966 RepID=A0ABD2PJD7_9PLAT
MASGPEESAMLMPHGVVMREEGSELYVADLGGSKHVRKWVIGLGTAPVVDAEGRMEQLRRQAFQALVTAAKTPKTLGIVLLTLVFLVLACICCCYCCCCRKKAGGKTGRLLLDESADDLVKQGADELNRLSNGVKDMFRKHNPAKMNLKSATRVDTFLGKKWRESKISKKGFRPLNVAPECQGSSTNSSDEEEVVNTAKLVNKSQQLNKPIYRGKVITAKPIDPTEIKVATANGLRNKHKQFPTC